MRGFICVLTFISAVTAAGKLERPSLGLIAELLRSPPQDGLEMDYCSPTLQKNVLEYSESHSCISLLCLQGTSHLNQVDHKNEEVHEVAVVTLEIRGDGDSIKVIVESIRWNSSITASAQLPHASEVLFDNNWTDGPYYQRWKHFLIKKLKLPSLYFRAIKPQVSFSRLKRNAGNASATSQLLVAIEQTIDFARSLEGKINETFNQISITKKRITKHSPRLSSLGIADLRSKGRKAEKRLHNIDIQITQLQKEKQDLKYDIDDFNVQLNAANVSQQYKDPLYLASFNGDGYAVMLDTHAYDTNIILHFLFKTSTPDGLLLFAYGDNSMKYWYSIVLLKGKLFFRCKLENGVKDYELYAEKRDDVPYHLDIDVDEWYQVQIMYLGGKMQIYVNETLRRLADDTPITWGPLYVGGVPDRPSYRSRNVSITSFTGCLQNITFNKTLLDFRNSIGLKNIGFNCTREEKVVPTKPYYFSGTGYASYKLPNGQIGENFALKFKFKTAHLEGILFSAHSSEGDALGLEIKNGIFTYYMDNGEGGVQLQHPNETLADNEWHTALAEKEGNFIKLTIDGIPKNATFAGWDKAANTTSLLYIGGIPGGLLLPDGLTIYTKFQGCLEMSELETPNCKLIQLEECTSQ